MLLDMAHTTPHCHGGELLVSASANYHISTCYGNTSVIKIFWGLGQGLGYDFLECDDKHLGSGLESD